MKFEESCFICGIGTCLIVFNLKEKRNYQEFTGIDVVELQKVKICKECKQKLENSLNFLRSCRHSYLNYKKQRKNYQHKKVEELKSVANDESCQDDNLQSNEEFASEIQNDPAIETIQEDLSDEKICMNKPKSKLNTRSHTNEKRYSCDWENCNMKFAQSNALICHKRIHLNEKPYLCKICGKRFTQNTTLKTHVVAKHEGNQVPCDFPGCVKKFPRNSFLLLHKKRDHENVRNYKCSECDKEYKQKSHLDRHFQSTHENIRHQCPFCEKSFSKSWSLKIHQFKHTESSYFPYKCSECDMSFQRRDMCIKHMSRLHPGIKMKDVVEIKVPSDILNKVKVT